MFESLQRLEQDAILGLIKLYKDDTNPKKVDLGVGVYRDDNGLTPVLKTVRTAEKMIYEAEKTKEYVGPAGDAGFNINIAKLLFGETHQVLTSGRARSTQTPGGCGALRVGAEFIMRATGGARIFVSDPTWANHVPLLGNSGLKIEKYPYYDYETNSINFNAMMGCLKTVGKGDLVLLHGCCHNPCGADLNREQWQEVAALAAKTGFTPFVDIAYQGFGEGLDEDAYGLRLLADTVPEMVVASSCSKNFGLYKERVGSVSVITESAERTDIAMGQILNVVRGNYSMPPSHGGEIVNAILSNPQLMADWLDELKEMRERIRYLREQLVIGLARTGLNRDFSFIKGEKGMFSFLGISKEQVDILVKNYSIYMVGSSRINVAGLNSKNIDYVCKSVAKVIREH